MRAVVDGAVSRHVDNRKRRIDFPRSAGELPAISLAGKSDVGHHRAEYDCRACKLMLSLKSRVDRLGRISRVDQALINQKADERLILNNETNGRLSTGKLPRNSLLKFEADRCNLTIEIAYRSCATELNQRQRKICIGFTFGIAG